MKIVNEKITKIEGGNKDAIFMLFEVNNLQKSREMA